MDERDIAAYVRDIVAACKGQTEPTAAVTRLVADLLDRHAIMLCLACAAGDAGKRKGRR